MVIWRIATGFITALFTSLLIIILEVRFLEYFMVVLFYSFLLITLVGMLVSYSLDWVMKKLNVTYFMMLFLYAFVGAFVGIIFLNFSLPSYSEEFGLLVITVLTAILYFHLDKLMKARYYPDIE